MLIDSKELKERFEKLLLKNEDNRFERGFDKGIESCIKIIEIYENIPTSTLGQSTAGL